MSDREPPEASYKKSWWPGWIWAVPIAALAIVAWLAFRHFAEQGPTVTVTFATAGGVKENDTKVKYKEMVVGEVESVTLQKDMQHVDIKLQMNAEMDRHLGPGTRYWIEGVNVSFSNLSSIKSLVAGPSIGVDPHPGDTVDHVQGLSQPPVKTADSAGTSYTLTTDQLRSVSRGSPIYYLDEKVGEVLGYRLADNGHGFEIYAFIQEPYDKLVHTGSRFWNASAVQLSLKGPGPSVRLESVQALINGGIAFETPSGPEGGERASADTRFVLYESKDKAEHAPEANDVAYRVTFDNQSGGLQAGAPVILEGTRVGTVSEAAFSYSSTSGALSTNAVLRLEPDRFGLASGSASEHSRAEMDAMMRRLVREGLRASLGKTTPLVGSADVELRFVPGASPAELEAGDPPRIPSGAGGDVQAIIAKANDVMDKIDQVPIQQIGQEVHRITNRVAALSESPALTDTLHKIDQSMTNIERITADARSQVGPILAQVRRTAQEAQQAVASAEQVMGSGGGAENAPNTAGLPSTLYELKRAARSMRELADYLDRHPEALIQGKTASR